LSEKELLCLVQQQVEEEGFVFVDLKLARHRSSTVLRVFADRLGGITVGECARLSRSLGLVLDNRGVFNTGYLLEVSSPGLERPLKTKAEFELRVGENIRLLYMNGEGRQRELSGKLESVSDRGPVLVTSDGSGTHEIEWHRISRGQIIL